MSSSKRNTLLTGLAILLVVGGILLWHFLISPWLERHKTDDAESRTEVRAASAIA